MKFIKCLLVLGLFAVNVSTMDYSVSDFGARGDGKTVNTRAIQRVIDLCAEKGGKMVIPQGEFVTGALFLKNDVTLRLEKGAHLLGSTNLADYPKKTVGFRFWGDTWAYQSLIIAHDIENITIEGDGTIDGRGGSFPVQSRKEPDKYRDRPYLLWFASSRNINITGIELRSSAIWVQSYIRCDQLEIDGVRIFSHSNLNNDMMDVDGCRDIIITRVTGDSDGGRVTFRSTCGRINENIIVSDYLLSSHYNALKFGTETTAGFKNVAINNCVIRRSSASTVNSGAAEGISGISLEIVDGGTMENITIQNVAIDDQRVPLFLRLGNRARKHYTEAPTPSVGAMKNILISNITAVATTPIGCSVMGIPEGKIEGLTICSSRFICTGDESEELADKEVEELETLYPESTMFGTLPTCGMYVRHARNIQLYGLSFELLKEDDRPAIICDDVDNADIQRIMTYGEKGGKKIVIK